MSARTVIVLALFSISGSIETSAETAWVSDQFRVPMKSGPSSEHRIVHRGIPSGTELVLLEPDEDAGFTLARTVNGTEGWLPNQFIVKRPVARLRIADAEVDLRVARAEIETLRTQLDNVPQLDTSEIARERDQLLSLNTRLRDEIRQLIETNRALKDTSTQYAFLIGAALVLVGVMIGAIARGGRGRRGGWS